MMNLFCFGDWSSNTWRSFYSRYRKCATKIIWISFFFFLDHLPGLGPCWSLSQLHMFKGRVHPWMSHQLLQGPISVFGISVPCSRAVLWKCPCIPPSTCTPFQHLCNRGLNHELCFSAQCATDWAKSHLKTTNLLLSSPTLSCTCFLFCKL